MAECLDIRKELEAIQREGKITSQEFAENLVRSTSPDFREQFIQACVDQGVLSAEYVEASRNKYNKPQDNKDKKKEEEKATSKHETDGDESQDDAMKE
ncbi:hypothetical protein PG984_007204 [Apiospora sp. TS-2023a]